MSDQNNLLPVPDKDGKIEVLLRNDDTYTEEAELSLFNVFVNMRKTLRLYAWIILLCLSIGLAAPYSIMLLKDKTASVSGVITFQYAKASDGQTPDGRTLDVNLLKSSNIIAQAIKKTHLSKEISVNSVAQNISISRMLSDNAKKQLEIMQKMDDATIDMKEPEKYVDFVNGMGTGSYRNQYIVTLNNGFGNENSSVTLSGSEMASLLNNIIDEYETYFFDTYDSFTLPDNTIEDISVEELDYIEWLDNMDDILNSLSNYCTSEEHGRFLNYRSKDDGLSFADINRMINLIRSARVDYLYAYVYYNGLAKDKERILTRFQYTLRNINHSLDSLNENITNGEQLIANYKNSNILVSRQNMGDTETEDINIPSITEYYNNLILKQANMYSDKFSTELSIKNLNEKISIFSKSYVSSSKLAVGEKEIVEVNDICRKLYELARRHAEEIVNSETYRNSFITEIGATDDSKFFSGDLIKKMLIGGAAGAFLGFALWFCKAFITEWKDADRRASGGAEEAEA